MAPSMETMSQEGHAVYSSHMGDSLEGDKIKRRHYRF
jgi:hypothetical protein